MAKQWKRGAKGRKSPGRKTKGKARGGYKAMNIVKKTMNPIPQRWICTMKYAETISTDANGQFLLNLNSIHDPNRSGIGHQPYGHDTFATLYNRYRVISCSYRIIANKNSDTLQICALPANDSILYLTGAEYKENPRTRYKTQAPGGEVQPVAGKVYIPSLVGRTKAQYMADDRYQSVFGASPAELAILNVGVFTGSDAVAASVPCNVELVYTVEMFDYKLLAQS